MPTPIPGLDQDLPDHLRAFDDTVKTRGMIYDGVLDAVGKRFPMEDDSIRLELHNPHYSGPQDFTLAQQKKALMSNRSLSTPIKGTWRLFDKASNQLLGEKEEVVMKVPYYSDRGTFIQGGNEYAVINQARLRAGVYTRKKKSGELESHFNVRHGSGKVFRLWMEPSTGIFRVNVGQANIPAYPFLQTLGVKDDDMKQAWGEDVFNANVNKVDKKGLAKLYAKFAGLNLDENASDDDKRMFLQQAVAKMELDEDVTATTLGMPSKTVTPQLLIRASRKLLDISRGLDQPDDREAPRFNEFLGVEDHLSERVSKDAGRAAKDLLWKLRRSRNLDRVQPGVLSSYMNSFILGSGLAAPIEETNPFQLTDQLHRITKMGQGGIQDPDAVIDEARDVNPNQLGFIDLVAGPECYDCNTQVYTSTGFKYWQDVNADTEFACLIDNRLEFHKASALQVYHVKDHTLHGIRTRHLDILVTSGHRVYVRNCSGSGNTDYHFEAADTALKLPRSYKTVYLPKAGNDTSFDLDSVTEFSDQMTLPESCLEADITVRQGLIREILYSVFDGRSQHGFTNKALARILIRLFVEAGMGVSVGENNDGITITVSKAATVRSCEAPLARGYYYSEDYTGDVYCATVPGGLLLVRRGFGVQVWLGNSEKIGIDVRASYGTYKGKDRKIYAKFVNNKGETEFLTPAQTWDKAVAFPGQSPDAKTVFALKQGKMVKVPAVEVDYSIANLARMQGPTLNMQIMPTGFMPSRAFYAAKYWSQYLPLAKPEAPLVMPQLPGTDQSFNEYYGRRIGTLNSTGSGVVTKVTDKGITVVDKAGNKTVTELPQNFPYNRLTGISYKAQVKPGDLVDKGDLLASSNFTDDKGLLSMGVNLRTAVVPYKGFSFDDAFVISDAAAKKLTTERLYAMDKDERLGTKISRSAYLSAFPSHFTVDQLKGIDSRGVAREGTILQKGDPIVLATGPKVLSSMDAQLGKLHSSLRNAVKDEVVTWDHDSPGLVVDVGNTTTGVKINVKSVSAAQVGDKLVNLESSKGVIAKIVPDDEMPVDPRSGEAYEMLLNPMVVLSRAAPNQLLELQLAKIAKLTGKPYILPAEAPEEGWAEFVKAELKKNGLSDRNDIYDPVSGKTIPAVAEGYMYTNAFHHLAEKKLSGRDTGGYTGDMQPGRGGKRGAKKLSGFDINGLLAHGATEVLRDGMLIRGNKNEDYWNALRSGRDLPEPQVPFVYNKFMALLKAGGMNTRKQGSIVSLMPLTGKDIDSISSGEIRSTEQVDAKTMRSIPGGLYDDGVTGGVNGNRWSHIRLDEPMPHPLMENPIRAVLGLRAKDLIAINAGAQELNGKTGGTAILEALSAVDVPKRIEELKDTISNKRGQRRDDAVKALRYLNAAQKQGLHPRDWMLDKVPVLPPIFRPISIVGDMIRESDLNGLYRDVIDTRNNITELGRDLPASELAEERGLLYDAVSAAMGYGEPVTEEGRSHRWKGAVRQVIGDSPKYGLFQSKVTSKTVDLVGRGVVVPDPNLDMDSVGIPEEKAWELYRPFVQRRLVRRGVSPFEAAKMVEDRSDMARRELIGEMDDRPILLDRAPTWHKHNILAFYPKLVTENVIRVSPLIVGGFNMDFDGDAANFHVPVSDKAVKEAKLRMLPSRNLFKLSDMRSVIHGIGKEMMTGLYQASAPVTGKPVAVFKTSIEALAALKAGRIDANTVIEVLDI